MPLANAFYGTHGIAHDFAATPAPAPNSLYANVFGVQTIPDLEALPAPADKSCAYVEDKLAEYFFDAESLNPIDGIFVVKPSELLVSQPGRWRMQKADVSSLAGTLVFQGVWNADTDTPTLTATTPTAGYYWYVDTAGSTNLGGITDWTVGDLAVSTGGGGWTKVDGNASVLSVNGKTGAVVLDTDDIAEGSINLYFTNARASAAAPVQSVAGKIGAVTLNPSDTPWIFQTTAVNYTATYGEFVVITASGVVVSLPAAPTLANAMKPIVVKRRHGGAASSVSGNGNSIDGSASVNLNGNGTAFEFVWNATAGEWNLK